MRITYQMKSLTEKNQSFIHDIFGIISLGSLEF